MHCLQASKPVRASTPWSPKPPLRKTPHAALLAAQAQRQQHSTAARFTQHSRLAQASLELDGPPAGPPRITSIRRPPSNLPSRLAGFPAWSSQLFLLSPSQAARGVAEARVQDVEGGTEDEGPRVSQVAAGVALSASEQERTSLPGLVPSSPNSLSDRLTPLCRNAIGHELTQQLGRTDSWSSISSVHPPSHVMQQLGGASVSKHQKCIPCLMGYFCSLHHRYRTAVPFFAASFQSRHDWCRLKNQLPCYLEHFPPCVLLSGN